MPTASSSMQRHQDRRQARGSADGADAQCHPGATADDIEPGVPVGTTQGQGAASGWTSLWQRSSGRAASTFNLHDLRRTVRTRMSQLGVSEEIAELAIGHLRRGLVGVYNKDEAWTKRIEAFELVSDAIAAIIADGSGAVPLRAR